MFLWRIAGNYPLIISKYSPYLFFCMSSIYSLVCRLKNYIKINNEIYIKTRGPLVLYLSPECWEYVKIRCYWEKRFKHSPRVGADNPLGPKFWFLMSTGRPHHYGHLLKVKKESLQPLTLYTSFHDLINVYSHKSGADNPRGQNFDVNRNLLSLWSFATS